MLREGSFPGSGSGTSFQEILPRKTQGSPRRPPKASPRSPQGLPKASQGAPKAFQGVPKAFQGISKASQGVPQGLPEGSPRQFFHGIRNFLKSLKNLSFLVVLLGFSMVSAFHVEALESSGGIQGALVWPIRMHLVPAYRSESLVGLPRTASRQRAFP